jgi:hypothetical protein
MALPGEGEHGSVMDESIDDGRCGHLVGKHLRPLLERQVRRQRNAAAFVPLGYELKEQVGSFSLKWNVSKLVNKEQIDTIEAAVVAFKRCHSLCRDQFHE